MPFRLFLTQTAPPTQSRTTDCEADSERAIMPVTLSAGLALAVPVKSDLLGERLEAYSIVVPVLRALRRCHRFGKGPKVHVTKLPAEIELIIEGLIIRDRQERYRDLSRWKDAFRHYEGHCSPMDHINASPLHDRAEDIDQCKSCREAEWKDPAACENRCEDGNADQCWTCSQKCDPGNCMRTCRAQINEHVNDMVLQWEPGVDLDGDCESWEKMIDQKGDFAKYQKVLRQHFGLDVFLSSTRIARQDHATWPRHLNHDWRDKQSLKTTLCYLTLAGQFADSKTYEESEMEADCGGGVFDMAQAIPIKPLKRKGDAKASNRFRRAMNILGLEVYLHPSQRSSLVLPDHEDDDNVEDPKENCIAGKSWARSANWPRLVLLVKCGFGG
ncbi:hypothetical protein M409DRAFT_49759 [Zasmidium cellare ATCC 36951]|uniref:Uncharacterized protein n=1 Tax=Zasmidium cellare ATCC 36951 TaxID=1080233 RepID=A0A6A6D1I9_ZASCE|nr:uncharacterized protein M409DRAFT_49759 [Zasmidium cellare ATCC 36951]KAF2173297.1 hypothetical protein M409DRAFT_49759 [Zasmidium cellare ATCC 36951]